MRTLITGIEGFTGRYVAAELRSAGHEVLGISLAPSAEEGVIVADIGDAAGLARAVRQARPEAVCHLAAISFVGHDDVDAIYRTNVVGTRNLLAALDASGAPPEAVLLASSAHVYGNASGSAIDESAPHAPANDYAVSKLAMEHMAALWSERLPITIVRPFNYTGVGQSVDFFVPKIVSHFRRRAGPLELGNLDVVRDFSDVRTVARRYRALLEGRVRGTFNICSGRGIALRDILEMTGELSGYRPELRTRPALVRSGEAKMLVGSGAALERALGPGGEIALRDTLAWMLGEAASA